MLINIHTFLKNILLTLFPKNCIGCKKPDFWICPSCIYTLPLSNNNPFPWSSSIFMYHHPIIRQAIWLLKFNKKHSVLGDIEEMLQKHFSNFLERHKFTHMPIVLVPIPLTKKSKAKRGYNQSTHIAKLLAKSRSDISVNENILKKTINHKPQNKIKDRSVRLTNIQSSFTAHIPEHAKNITIILIDDVITTGATLNEARKTLIRSGAKKVYGFSLAH